MHELLELGGVLTVTFRNSIANFRLFSLTDPTDPTDPTDLLSVFRPCSVRVPSVWVAGDQSAPSFFVCFVVKKSLFPESCFVESIERDGGSGQFTDFQSEL